jgi:serine phosphatase RsbU (regulator of sigma subunit)
VIRTGEAELIAEVPEEFLVAAAQDDDHLRILREIGFLSVCIVPLIARGRVLGDIALATDAESGRRLGPETLALTRELADRCALALDNATLYGQRDLVAMSLQEELLPPELPQIQGLDVGARYVAAGEGNQVGGDFYDVFPSERGWRIVIGDVVGKGPAAAAVTGLARHTLRAAAPYERSPSALLSVLNRALLAERAGQRMASVACVELEPDGEGLELTVSAAGHPLPLVVDAGGEVREVGRFGPLLGVDANHNGSDVRERLLPGELLVLYTDGVVEARGPSGVFGEGRLRALLRDLAGQAPTRVVQRIEGAVLAASGGRPRDDLAIVALRVRGRR